MIFIALDSLGWKVHRKKPYFDPMNTYTHAHVKAVRKLQYSALELLFTGTSLGKFLKSYAQNLEAGFQVKNEAVFVDISNYYKPLIGRSKELVFNEKLGDVQFLNIAASVHGFASYDLITNKEEILNATFEKAVEYVVSGNIEKLAEVLQLDSALTNRHSLFGHKAQLIHYCASNAVEIYRQVVPDKLLEIIKLLIKYGADPKVKIPVYGGHFDYFELFSTSAHPIKSGVDKEIYQWFDSITE